MYRDRFEEQRESFARRAEIIKNACPRIVGVPVCPLNLVSPRRWFEFLFSKSPALTDAACGRFLCTYRAHSSGCWALSRLIASKLLQPKGTGTICTDFRSRPASFSVRGIQLVPFASIIAEINRGLAFPPAKNRHDKFPRLVSPTLFTMSVSPANISAAGVYSWPFFHPLRLQRRVRHF